MHFFGAALFRIHELGGLDALTSEDMLHIAEFANATGALCTTRRGAIPAMPTQEEVEGLLGGNV